MRFLLAFIAVVVLYPASAFAACVGPSGSEGEIVYNTTYKVVQFCNGSNWVSTGGSSDTLATLSCTNGEIAKWNGAAWACAADASGSGGISALTGEVTASGTGSVVATIATNAVTNAKMADNAIGSAEITNASIALADLSATGTASATTYLRGDNTWATVSASSAWASITGVPA